MEQCLGQSHESRGTISQASNGHGKVSAPPGPRPRVLVPREFRWAQTARLRLKKDESFFHVIAARQHARTHRWSAACSCITSLQEGRYHDRFQGTHLQTIVDKASFACAESTQWESSLMLLAHLDLQRAPDRSARERVGLGMAALQRWRQSLAYFEFLAQFGMRPYQSYYSVTMHSCGEALRWDWSLELLFHLCRSSVAIQNIAVAGSATEAAFLQAAYACRRAGSPSSARSALNILHTARRMSATTPNLYVQIMSACCRSSIWASTLMVLEQVGCDGLQPNLGTCTASLVACGMGLPWESAGFLLDCIEWKWHLHPIEGTFRPVLEACHSSSNWAPTLAYLRHMRLRHLRPDARRLASAARSLLKNKLADQALGVIGEMQECGMDAGFTARIVFTAGMQTCADSAAWSHASHLLGKFSAFGLEVDMQLLCAAASATRRAGLWTHVLRLLCVLGVEVDIASQNLAVSACACVRATAP